MSLLNSKKGEIKMIKGHDYVWELDITIENREYVFIDEVLLFRTRQDAREYKQKYVKNFDGRNVYEGGWSNVPRHFEISKKYFTSDNFWYSPSYQLPRS